MIEYLLFIISLCMLGLSIYLMRTKEGFALYLLKIMLSSLFGLGMLFFYYGAIHGTFILLAISILAPTLFYTYSKHNYVFGGIILLIYACAGYWLLHYGYTAIPIIQIFGIGMLISSLPITSKNEAQSRKNKQLETKRDVAQIIIGIIVLGTVYFINYNLSLYLVLGYMLFGYMLNSIMASSNSTIAHVLKGFERNGVMFGKGALYLGVGTMIILGFISSKDIALASLSALFISDSVATIIGIRTKRKLLYNKHKSIGGFIGYFISLSAIGYLFIGIYSVPFAFVLAFIESISSRIDDNITIALACFIIYRILIFL